MGESALAISSVLKSIYIFVGIPAWSLASTANTVVANIWGQGKIELISKALWRVVKVSFLLSFVFILGLILFPTQVLAFYLPNNTDLLKDSISSLYVITIALTIMSFSTILYMALWVWAKRNSPLLLKFVVLYFICSLLL